MPALQIINIYNELISLPDQGIDSVIDFYNSRSLIINNTTSLDTEADLIAFMVINHWYTSALVNKKQFNNTLSAIAKVLPVIDVSIEKINPSLRENPSHQAIMFSKAVACNQLKDYSSAYDILKELVKIDPDNDQYKIWLRGSNLGRQKIKLTIITYIFGAMILIGQFKGIIPNSFVKLGVTIIGTIGVIGCIIYEQFFKRHFRKAKV